MIKEKSYGRLHQGRSGELGVNLVSWLLRSGEENGFVRRAEVKAALAVEILRELVGFVDEETN
jgi:hypothetical protein